MDEEDNKNAHDGPKPKWFISISREKTWFPLRRPGLIVTMMLL